MRTSCPVCGSEHIKHFLTRQHVPVMMHLLYDTLESAQKAVRGNLDLFCCQDCTFVFNASFDETKIDYGSFYNNNQSYSTAFRDHLEKMCENIASSIDLSNKRVIEIGCGKGDFLKLLKSKYPSMIGYGFDTSCVVEDNGGSDLHFIQDYYSSKYSHIKADVLISRHVIEHISEPILFLKSIREAIQNQSDAMLFIETPDIEWILKNRVFWDFFYEHCSYFCSKSLAKAFNLSGFNVESIHNVFDGQYIWAQCSVGGKLNTKFYTNEVPALAEQFLLYESEMHTKIAAQFNKNRDENIVVWGAGAKGVTFCNIFDPNSDVIDAVIDINEAKHDKFLPGTGHIIKSAGELESMRINRIIVMNPNYRGEIEDMLAARCMLEDINVTAL